MSRYELATDGACVPNPGGVASYGVVLWAEKSDAYEEVDTRAGLVGRGPGMTNNVAEYAAMLEGLRLVLELAEKDWLDRAGVDLLVDSDSQLVINQLLGKWRVTEGKLYVPYYRQTATVLKQVEQRVTTVALRWIPREQNERADSLSQHALYDAGVVLPAPVSGQSIR